MVLILTCCVFFMCVFASSAGSWGSATIYVQVTDLKYRSPVSWAYVAVDNRSCAGLGSGVYRITVSPGWHCVYVSGVYRWVYVGCGHKWVPVYI